jgi:hypothetical protein
MTTADNLLQGPARIYVASAGSDLPTSTDIASLVSGDFSGWTYAGDTTSATTLKDTPSYSRAQSQQTARVLDIHVTELVTTIETTAREVTVERLRDMVRGTVATASGVSTVTPSGLGAVPKFAVAIVGPWPGGTAMVVVERAAYIDATELTWDSQNFTEVPVQFEVLEGDALTGGYVVYVTTDGAPVGGGDD